MTVLAETKKCFICLHPGTYDLDSCKLLIEFPLCKDHETHCRSVIEGAPKTYVIREFVPKEVKVKREWYEPREPGEEG